VATNAGIRVTQPGVSVPYAADYQYVFNSDWPSLAIAFETTIALSNTTTRTVIPHPLGFVPFMMCWILNNGTTIGRACIRLSYSNYGSNIWAGIDSSNIYIYGPATYNYSSPPVLVPADPTITYQVNIKLYNLDITKSVDYTLPKLPVTQNKYDPSTGIKVTKYSKSMGSNDLRDYILHSRAQSPAVLSIVANASTYSYNGTIFDWYVYRNPVSYTPYSIGYIHSTGFNLGGKPISDSMWGEIEAGSQQSIPMFRIISPGAPPADFYGCYMSGISSTNAVGDKASIVVLRDPLIIPNTLRVIY
jgi:hypothetical protein